MLVFIDESGDPGFKLTKGSSPIFVTAMVIFDTTEDAKKTQLCIEAFAKKRSIKPEIKFSRLRSDYRDEFFDAIQDCRFRIRAVVVDKSVIYSDTLRTVKTTFYKFFIRQMIEKSEASLIDAHIVIDGSGDNVFKKQFTSYLKRKLDKNAVKRISLKDSEKDSLIQLADMAAGAIARSYKPKRADSNRWRSILLKNAQIENVWEFK